MALHSLVINCCYLSSVLIAVVSALKGLQEKIRKLELERADAEDNLKKLATESRHYKDALQKELTVRESTQGVIAKQNKGIKVTVLFLIIVWVEIWWHTIIT